MANEIQIPNVVPPESHSNTAAARPRRRGWAVGAVVLLVFAAIFIYGIVSRLRNAATVRTETTQMALPSVTVISPQHSAPTQEVVLPGNVQPFISAPIFSRTNGYLKSWFVDIGQHVKKGQLLAIVETP